MPDPTSAVEPTVPFIHNVGSKNKWSTQWVKVSVKDLAREDQIDLSRALSESDRVRARLSVLARSLRAMPRCRVKSLLKSRIADWRNRIKHSLEYFLERLLFPLKELGIEGRRYLVFLEDFSDPSIRNRSFTVLCNSAGFGNFSEVRKTLFSHL